MFCIVILFMPMQAYPEAAAAQAAVERLETVIAASSPPLYVGLAPDGAPAQHKPASEAGKKVSDCNLGPS
jgi:hypothetical protein